MPSLLYKMLALVKGWCCTRWSSMKPILALQLRRPPRSRLLFFIAAVAGWVDTLAGGGGLITVPTLLLTGMSPSMAIATNKLQGSMGTFVASLYFVRTQFVCLNEMKGMITLTFIGSVLGSWVRLAPPSAACTDTAAV